MRKNLISKALLGVLICSTLIPAAASSKYYSKQNFDVNLGPHQAVTDMGARYCGHNGIGVNFTKLTKTKRVDVRALDEAGRDLTDGWRKKENTGGTHWMSLYFPTSGDQNIHVQFRNYYNTKKVVGAEGIIYYKR